MYRRIVKSNFHNYGALINTFFTKLLSLLFFEMPRFYRRTFTRRSAYGKGTRRFNVVIPCAEAFQMTVGAGAYWSNLVGIAPYLSFSGNRLSYASLVSSVLYRTYAQLYDEVKINGCTVKISLMSNIGSGGLVPAVNLVTAWDRNAKKSEIVDGQGIPTTVTLATGSESQSSLIVNNSRAIVYRSNRASDLQERCNFHDCSFSTYQSTGFADNEWLAGMPVGYCPSLQFAMQTSTAPGAGSSYVFDVAVEVKWYVTFRNPKFGLASGNAKGIAVTGNGEKFTEIKEIAVNEIKEDDAETEEAPVLKKKKVVYEEEVIPDEEDEEEDESQEPLTQPFKSPMKKAGKKSSS